MSRSSIDTLVAAVLAALRQGLPVSAAVDQWVAQHGNDLQDAEDEIQRLGRQVESLTGELARARKDIATLLEQLSDANVRLNERDDA